VSALRPGCTVVSPPPRVSTLASGADTPLTVRQVAAQLGVTPITVYRLVGRGVLAHLRVSNAIRIDPAALAAYLATGIRIRR